MYPQAQPDMISPSRKCLSHAQLIEDEKCMSPTPTTDCRYLKASQLGLLAQHVIGELQISNFCDLPNEVLTKPIDDLTSVVAEKERKKEFG